MKPSRKIRVRKFLKGKIGSSRCTCCGIDCLITVSGLCLKCMRRILIYLNETFSNGGGSPSTTVVRRPKKFKRAMFDSKELAQMSGGARRKHLKKKKRFRHLEDEDIPVRRQHPGKLRQGFEWTDVG